MVKKNYQLIILFAAFLIFFLPRINSAKVAEDNESTVTRYSFYEILKQECVSNCDFQESKWVTGYFFEPNSTKIIATISDFTGTILVGSKYQCYYKDSLSATTDIDYCVLTSTPIDTPDDPSSPTTSEPSTSSPATATNTNETNGELTVELNADITAGIEQNKCPSGATTITRNGETFLAYPKGILKDVSCEGATKTLGDVLLITRNIVNTLLLPAVGTLFIIMLLVGGIMYITSAGNPKQVERGKAILTAAIIGLLIVTLSYTIIAIFTNLLGGRIT